MGFNGRLRKFQNQSILTPKIKSSHCFVKRNFLQIKKIIYF